MDHRLKKSQVKMIRSKNYFYLTRTGRAETISIPVLKLFEIECKIAVQNNVNSNVTLTSHSNSLQTNMFIIFATHCYVIVSFLPRQSGKICMAVCEL